MKERDRDILEHVVKYCDQIEGTVAMFDETLETLKANHVYRNAVSMCVLQIGELTNHLTAKFRDNHTQIPWNEIKGMRNIAAHQYKKFSMEILHKVITDKVPELRSYCQKLLDNA